MSGFFPEDQYDYDAPPSAGIPREQLLKELLPGMQELFGLEMEAQEVARVKKSIGKGDEPFIPRDVYVRVVDDYEKKLTEIKDKNMTMIKKASHVARKDGVNRAADLVESMAEEMGSSNLLHAVVLALRNMDIPE